MSEKRRGDLFDSHCRQSRACPGVIYVRPTVNTAFIDKHCCSSVLMLRPTVWNSLP